MKKIINKGYTLTVVSWENDGDNYNTKTMTVDTREEAQAIHLMCTTLFKSCNNGENGIGNMMEDDDDRAEPRILEFMNEHPILLEKYKDESNDDETAGERLISICRDYNYDLMGGSEWYYSRVCESCTVTYSAEDIFLEEINF